MKERHLLQVKIYDWCEKGIMFKMWYFYLPLDPDCYTLVYEATQKTTVLPPVNKTCKAYENTEHCDKNKYVQLLICSYADWKHFCKVYLCKIETLSVNPLISYL